LNIAAADVCTAIQPLMLAVLMLGMVGYSLVTIQGLFHNMMLVDDKYVIF
jgi:hypothetical protein